jgi:LPXTG-motif cell wall-anchored protein
VATNTFVAPPVPTRSIELTKHVDGEGIPTDAEFVFSLTCTDGAGDALAGFPQDVRLAADESVTVDGIPVGSSCALDETDAAGADSVRYQPGSTVQVTDASPAVIAVVATNTYVIPTRSIELTKHVEGEGIPTDAEFVFSLTCTDGAGDALAGFPQDVRLAADESVTVDGIPVGSSCALDETDAAGADSVRYQPGSTIQVTEDSPEVIEVVATNTFVLPITPTPTPTPTTPAPEQPAAPGGDSGSEVLAITGADVLSIAALVGVLLLSGAVLVVVRSRRRSHQG